MTDRSTDAVVYQSRRTWNRLRPRILVIACSDGRMQEEVDAFLLRHLHVSHYDRLYLPGGPGALAYSGGETARTAQQRRECLFLIEAHAIRRVVLIFHGPSRNGPAEATCADYQRKLPGMTPEQIRRQQEADVVELVRWRAEWAGRAQLNAYRCEVNADNEVQFVALTALAREENDTGSLREAAAAAADQPWLPARTAAASIG
jgi:hypothetical protein